MSTAARKARKRERVAAGFPEATQHEKDPKRPTRHYLTKQERQKLNRQLNIVKAIAAAKAAEQKGKK